MGSDKSAIRILVADDDPEVLAHYRSIFGIEDISSHAPHMEELDNLISLLSAEESQSSASQEGTWDVVIAHQGDEAIHQAQMAQREKRAFTHAILDVRMPPGMDGIKTAMQLRKINPEIELIFVTAYSDYMAEEINELLGSTWRLLKKPFHEEDVMALLSV